MSADSDYYGNGWWVLRSPNYTSSNLAWAINHYGYANRSGTVDYTDGGVVPALRIRL